MKNYNVLLKFKSGEEESRVIYADSPRNAIDMARKIANVKHVILVTQTPVIPTQVIRITGCSSGLYWYANHVGKELTMTQQEDGDWVINIEELKRVLGYNTKIITATIDREDFELL